MVAAVIGNSCCLWLLPTEWWLRPQPAGKAHVLYNSTRELSQKESQEHACGTNLKCTRLDLSTNNLLVAAVAKLGLLSNLPAKNRLSNLLQAVRLFEQRNSGPAEVGTTDLL